MQSSKLKAKNSTPPENREQKPENRWQMTEDSGKITDDPSQTSFAFNVASREHKSEDRSTEASSQMRRIIDI
ncbi:MAG: hypothetical protein ISS66_15945 [Desulfobacteraceae bacterium]|nr:hypothetical protein [Desulfobacteraceae bacterium]